MYIPRKFRNDNRHRRDKEESIVINKLDIQRFQAECEILKIRRDNYETDIKEIDSKMNEALTASTKNIQLQNELKTMYNTFIEKDVKRISKK